MNSAGAVLVAGIGRTDRGDDGVGLVVADAARDALRESGVSGVDVVALAEPMSLLEAWAGYRRVVVVDAVLSGRPGGSVTIEEVGAGPLSARLGGGGTHDLGLPDVVELGRALGSLPAQLTIVGVEAVDFGLGNGLSPLVTAAIEATSRLVAAIATGAARASLGSVSPCCRTH